MPSLLHHVLPTLGDVELAALTRTQVRGWLLGLLGGGMAPQGVRFCLTCLSSLLTAAVDQEIIPANVAHGAAKRLRLRHKDNPRRALTPVEFRLFFGAAQAIFPRFADFFELLLLTGVRIGEALGLRADDFDEVARALRIERTYHGGQLMGPDEERRHAADRRPVAARLRDPGAARGPGPSAAALALRVRVGRLTVQPGPPTEGGDRHRGGRGAAKGHRAARF